MEKTIELVSKPKIVHKLIEVGAGVTKRIEDLNLENLVATEETVKSLKTLRADLNKELDSYEEQRKYVKTGILNPYNEFEEIYKTEISEKYKKAIDTLKDKIASVENKIKIEKRDNVITYYKELCTAEKIDFVPFEKLGLEINLSTTEKAYKEKCNEFISNVKDDLTLIQSTDFQAETLTEYKQTLNISQAITTVKKRKDDEKIETARIKQLEINNRIQQVISSGFSFDDFGKIYIFNDEIFITEDFLKESTKDEFNVKLIECQEKIKTLNASDKPETKQAEMDFSAPAVSPASAPKKEEIVTASFKVTGTMIQLRALGQYMRDNKIKYQNL